MLAPIRPSPTIPSWGGVAVVIAPSCRSLRASERILGLAPLSRRRWYRRRDDQRSTIRRARDLRDHGRPRAPQDVPRPVPAGASHAARGPGHRLRTDRMDRRRPARARAAIEEHGPPDHEALGRFLARLRYVGGDTNDPTTFDRVRESLGAAEHPLFYLETPPSLFGTIVHGLAAAKLTEGA